MKSPLKLIEEAKQARIRKSPRSFYIDDPVYEELLTAANEQGVSASALINALIQIYLQEAQNGQHTKGQ